MEIRPFEEGDVGPAAAQVASRHSHHRRLEPLLPAAFEDPEACERELRAALAGGAVGAAAADQGTLRGFLVAEPGDGPRGRHVWSDLCCHAFDDDPEVMRLLYSELAPGWMEDGRGHHYAMVPRIEGAGDAWAELGFGDAVVGVWLSLGYGYEQVHGIRSTDARERAAEGARVRRAGPSDLERMSPLFPLIANAHRGAPTLAFIDEEFVANLTDGHHELLEDPSVGYWLAQSGNDAIGFAAFRPIPDDETSIEHPPGSVELTVAATAPSARGRGVMGALVASGLNWARSEGFDVCVTDWRAGNLDSSRAWPRLGFRPFAYRLHRIVDPRLLP